MKRDLFYTGGFELKTYMILALLQAVLLAVQGTSYLLIQRFQGEFHDMSRGMDRKIPLLPEAVYIYCLWYPLLFLYPLYVFSCSPSAWTAYILAILLDVGLSLVIYVLYPTSFTRPEPDAALLSGKILRLLYFANYKGLNCMPSMHCSQCFIILFSAVSCYLNGIMPAAAAAAVFVLSLMIVLSTVLIKQHVLLDAVTALPLGILCFAAAHMYIQL